jgi:hypothetical protein
LLDACVLYPTVMREMLLGVAAEGAFEPRWSGRILEEWARAARKLGPAGEPQARAEIAVAQAGFPQAAVPVPEGLAARLWLPDANDVHVLAAAIAGSCDGIVTLNAKDFPRQILRDEGLSRQDPDGLIYDFWTRDNALVERVAARVLDEARRLSGEDWQMRALLKKARLPRVAKALG